MEFQGDLISFKVDFEVTVRQPDLGVHNRHNFQQTKVHKSNAEMILLSALRHWVTDDIDYQLLDMKRKTAI